MNNDFHFSKNNIAPSGIKKSSVIKERVSLITAHMYKQYLDYVKSSKNTSEMFNRILNDLEDVAQQLRDSFGQKNMPSSNIFYEVDADRSVGIMNILWHSISITTRGNTRPQALYRKDCPPLFCGRILALNGNFLDASLDLKDQEYPEILNCEIASLYIPADPTADCIIKVRHLGDVEYKVNPIDAPKEFVLKVIEIICGGGFFHEELCEEEIEN